MFWKNVPGILESEGISAASSSRQNRVVMVLRDKLMSETGVYPLDFDHEV